MKRFKYEVSWDSDITNEYGKTIRYNQEFDTLEDARLALALHNSRKSELKVTIE